MWNNENLIGFAICHYGAGSEADSDTCYIKFGAVSSGKNSSDRFTNLLDDCEIFRNIIGMSKLVAGVNTSRQQAYFMLLSLF
ncbi:MAG: hypothetical protein WBA93_29475 [Microcoleaceae cyanobacterium]